LAERESLSGATDGANLINSLKNRQQVEINAAQVEHLVRLHFCRRTADPSWWT
jgi:hypothetical protein